MNNINDDKTHADLDYRKEISTDKVTFPQCLQSFPLTSHHSYGVCPNCGYCPHCGRNKGYRFHWYLDRVTC